MDPTGSPCLRSPPGPAPLWDGLRNAHAEGRAASGPPHCPPAAFSFRQKPDFLASAAAAAAYPDFSASCLAAAPHSLPREQRIFTEQHPAFPQPPDWHLPVPEVRQRPHPGPVGGPGETVASSPGLVEAAGGPGEDCGVQGSSAGDAERTLCRRRKAAAGQSVVPEPEDEVEAGEGGPARLPPGSGH
ncbi:homeobox protein MOX-1 isoform X2 [Octodon degus]|uniref:Homeobox protein MOX-1 isoform X2 n=1 Tax=Octodon degus TaxID=10160 RepID=A0A6P6EPJ1_OCTDE|nr:homeobox protein MOX-1 isoform X2 [Octodon degus]